MRAWLAIALLSVSWLFGLGYFEPVQHLLWCGLVALAVFLLYGLPIRLPGRALRLLALVAVLPALWCLALPYKAIGVLLAAGLACSVAPIPRLWLRNLGRGAIAASLILLTQAVVLEGYQIGTARTHEVPRFLAWPTVGMLRLAGADVTLDGPWLVTASTYGTERFAASWELLFDPATVLFLSGCVLLLTMFSGRLAGVRRSASSVFGLLVFALAWWPVRAALLVGLVTHQLALADPVLFPNVGRLLVSTWMHAALLAPLVAVAGTLLPSPWARRIHIADHRVRAPGSSGGVDRNLGVAALAVLGGMILLAASWSWTPIGQSKPGRVLVVERHSTWEPTTEPYGTDVYGEAGSYNYAAAYAYCAQYFHMGRILESDSIDDETLSTCDVLVIKTPTARYDAEEVAAVVRFVEQGGSALLIGDHTNVFNMNTYLNDIGRRLGFTFRNDLLFRVGSPYEQAYRVPRAPHPIVMHVPPMNFAVSCSIDPGRSVGRMPIRNTGLFSLPPAYQESNYHPQAEYRPYMQYGAWCQLWAATHGRGRVVAFADSTLFSNFCVFQPGKKELLVGMLSWLNRSSGLDWLPARLVLHAIMLLCGLALLLFGFRRAQRRGAWLVLVALGLSAWCLTTVALHAIARRALPYPTVTQNRMQHVVIDRQLSEVPLFTGAFADDQEGNGYGLLEQWIPRIGCYISRQSDDRLFSGDGLVVICPSRLPGVQYRNELVRWVRNGGQLVVFDTPDMENSTANSLLMLFGMQSVRSTAPSAEGPLQIEGLDTEVPLQNTCQIVGGEPLAQWNDLVAAAQVSVGKGTVTAIGFGSLFNDAAMGYHWLVEPDADTLDRYEALYALLRAGLPSSSDDRPPTPEARDD